MPWPITPAGISVITPATNNPGTKSGAIVPIAGTADSQAVFNKVFTAPQSTSAVNKRTPVIDQVFANYQRLRQSNRRLSTADGQRLDEHLTRLQEIQRRSKVVISCNGVSKPSMSASKYWVYPGPKGVADSIPAFQLLNDVIVAAFLCGTCRIATLDGQAATAPFTDYLGGFHGTIDFHGLIHLSSQTDDPELATQAQAQVYPAWQRYFEHVFLDLIAKLDTDNGMGGSLLDDCLVAWEQECCHITHNGATLPLVTAGGAGGALQTGSFIDYRNTMVTRMFPGGAKQSFSPGLIWNQWMGVKLQAMGVQRAEYGVALGRGRGRVVRRQLLRLDGDVMLLGHQRRARAAHRRQPLGGRGQRLAHGADQRVD